MTFQLFMIITCVLAGIVGFLVWGAWRHHAQHRDLSLRYENHRLTPPPSTVCPKCRRRAYGRRAVEQQYCEPCDLHYGEHRSAA